MSVGLVPTKNDVDNQCGNIASSLCKCIDNIITFSNWLSTQTDTQLENLGYSTTDVANLRSSFNDLIKLTQIFTGQQTLNTVYDFRNFVKLIWGFGNL